MDLKSNDKCPLTSDTRREKEKVDMRMETEMQLLKLNLHMVRKVNRSLHRYMQIDKCNYLNTDALVIVSVLVNHIYYL